ncbi:UDP-glucose 4-epimerase GalE [Candidatus Saccharibacteria bacterium]|nr:UDP-glucose 4-epimerase GalE [Candidatus Saccharibacteria bacterium]
MKVLVTGGTGYIGSHVVVQLIEAGHEVVIVDNLCNSKENVLDRITEITETRPKFYKADLLDARELEKVFGENKFEVVMHFAGLKAVAESVEQPLKYYENNITGTINLLKSMRKHDVKKIIFSSSATVYGEPKSVPIAENAETGRGITNPYGRTKYMIEEILRDICNSDKDFSATILRYFNPVGAHESGLLGENPNGRPNNLMPIVMKVAKGEYSELSVFGNDYATRDGTCIRDYIHVVDLARGHLAALDEMRGLKVYNLGTGKGTSVLEMIAAFEKASGEKLSYRIVDRRAGDLAELCADPKKAEKELGWKADRTIDGAMRDTLNFLRKN